MEKFYKLYVQMRVEGLELEDELLDISYEFESELEFDGRWVNIQLDSKSELESDEGFGNIELELEFETVWAPDMRWVRWRVWWKPVNLELESRNMVNV